MEERSNPNEMPADPTLPAQGRTHILYAEDDPLLADLVKMILQTQGWQVTCVTDGEKAVRAWEREKFDLILMDLQMPNMDGFEATRLIRKQENGCHVPIVALTATGDRDGCLTAGMDGILTKPFQMTGLIEAITRHLNG